MTYAEAIKFYTDTHAEHNPFEEVRKADGSELIARKEMGDELEICDKDYDWGTIEDMQVTLIEEEVRHISDKPYIGRICYVR